MERSNEIILQNVILENVFRYLLEKLKGLGGATIDRTGDDGTIYLYCIQYVHPSSPGRIDVKYTTSVTPQGNTEKSYGYWGDLIAMSFEGLQLQANTVLIKAECQHPFIVSIFDRYWADMLKAFGAAQPVNTIADKQGGTIIYERNEQGQTTITGGTINPGYKAEIGPGVAIKPYDQQNSIGPNHSADIIPPGHQEKNEQESNSKRPNAQINQRAMIWRDLQAWVKLGNIAPTPKDCIAELKKKPAYKNRTISIKRMQTILNEGFAGKYKEILKNV